jgi:hypothetical protein
MMDTNFQWTDAAVKAFAESFLRSRLKWFLSYGNGGVYAPSIDKEIEDFKETYDPAETQPPNNKSK